MITVDRRGVSRTFRIVTNPGPGGQSAIGVYLAGYFAFPFTVRLNGSSCSGNGCDLMFALALMDKLTPLNLTSGAFVAGAGTLDDTGDVGPVFGINVLLADLRGQGATVFLTPAANCAQALELRRPGCGWSRSGRWAARSAHWRRCGPDVRPRLALSKGIHTWSHSPRIDPKGRPRHDKPR